MECIGRRYTPRLYVAEDLSAGNLLRLTPDQSHYIAHVMRRKSGEDVIVFNGRDGEWHTTIGSTDKNQVSVTVKTLRRPQHPENSLALIFSLIKRDHQDFLIQKATEIGVTHFFPILTDHCNTRAINLDRMKLLAREAAEQADRLSVPVFADVQSLEAALNALPQRFSVFACLEAGEAQPLSACLAQPSSEDTAPAFLVGPEGGLSAAERNLLLALPAIKPVHLGPRLLRADTAAIAALSCWQAMYGEWRNHDRINT